MKLLSITSSFAIALSLLEIGSVVAIEAKRSNGNTKLRGGRTIIQQEILTNKKASSGNGNQNDIHRKTQSLDGVNNESSITTTITVEDKEEISYNPNQIDIPAAPINGEIMIEDFMESKNQDKEEAMGINEEMIEFEKEEYEEELEEEEFGEMTMESYYNDEHDLQNNGEDQETLSVITLDPEEEGQGRQSDNDGMYYDNEMVGELTGEEFDEMMKEMYNVADGNEEFVDNTFFNMEFPLEEEETVSEMEEMDEMEEMEEMGEMEEMQEMHEMEEMGEKHEEEGSLDEAIDEEDEATVMTLEPAE